VGVGDSLEAGFALAAPIAAGTWHLVADGLLLGQGVSQADVNWDVVWRAGGDAGADTVLATFTHHYAVAAGHPFDAIPCEADGPGVAAPAHAGDLLILRVTPTGGDPMLDFVPNGDGTNAHGRIPRLDLPRSGP
jgi:hypothetical protein